MKKPQAVRKIFLDFFHQRGHKIVPSSSLIPEDDPSVLLTTAGMQQFKKYYTQEKNALEDFGTQRTTSVQKCFRTTDIEEVGDETHLTFFEMLGNFSFGPVGSDNPQDYGSSGYYKQSAITWAFEFLTKILNLKIDYVTIFKGEEGIPLDEESYKVWKNLGFSDEKIKKMGKEDNFWGPTGEEGPCGPTTEIYIDGIEVWNLVFNEYYQQKDKTLKKLSAPGVDTGAGFERLMKVIEKSPTIFETQLFEPIKQVLISSVEEEKIQDQRSLRIILDHLRGTVFLIADGVFPSNLGRGYILRRILRRLAFQWFKLSIPISVLEKSLNKIIELYGDFYPEIDQFEKIKKIINEEWQKFWKILERSWRLFEKFVKNINDPKELGKKAFWLYGTYGVPLEIFKELAINFNLQFTSESESAFQTQMEWHRKISKKTN